MKPVNDTAILEWASCELFCCVDDDTRHNDKTFTRGDTHTHTDTWKFLQGNHFNFYELLKKLPQQEQMPKQRRVRRELKLLSHSIIYPVVQAILKEVVAKCSVERRKCVVSYLVYLFVKKNMFQIFQNEKKFFKVRLFYKYISLRKQGIHLSVILQFYNFSAHCVRVNNTLVLFLMPNWQVYVCESVRARACVCAFNSFGMIMRKIKHTPHTAVHAHLKCWAVEWESKLCYGWVRFLTGKWSAPAALSMLFMCHALLTHLICLKSTILKHSPFPIHIHTHTHLGVLGTAFYCAPATTCRMSYEYNNTIIKKTWKSNFYAST